MGRRTPPKSDPLPGHFHFGLFCYYERLEVVIAFGIIVGCLGPRHRRENCNLDLNACRKTLSQPFLAAVAQERRKTRQEKALLQYLVIQTLGLRRIMRFSCPNEDVFLVDMGCGYGRHSSNDLTSSPHRLIPPEPSSLDSHFTGRAPQQLLPHHGQFRRGAPGYEPKRRRLGHGNSSASDSLGSNQPVPKPKFHEFSCRHHARESGARYRRLLGQWGHRVHRPSAARNCAGRWQYLQYLDTAVDEHDKFVDDKHTEHGYHAGKLTQRASDAGHWI